MDNKPTNGYLKKQALYKGRSISDRPSSNNNQSSAPQMAAEQEQAIIALLGATEGICCALEQDSISTTEIQCLLKILIKNLQDTLS